jgi:hypothetical protein
MLMRLCMSKNSMPNETQPELVFPTDLTTAISYNIAFSFCRIFYACKKDTSFISR